MGLLNTLQTALGGLVALLLLAIPPGRDVARYPDTLHWGIGCGRPDNRARQGRGRVLVTERASGFVAK